MQLDSRHLEHLAVIVEVGTLQQAAAKIGTSQPALSRMISNLEARIGMPLFERTKRPLKPTAIGLELSQQGHAIRTARLRASEMVDFGVRGFFGVLKIGAPPFLCQSLMSEVIASFLKERPGIRIDLVPDYHVGLMERLYINQLDVIVGPSKFVELGNTDMQIEPLFRDANSIVGRVGHPILSNSNPSVEELEAITWVGHSDKSMMRSDMDLALQILGVRNPKIAFQSESASAVLELLRETDFLTMLPRYAVREDGSDGLQVVDLPQAEQDHQVSAITLAERSETKLTGDFKTHLRARVIERFPTATLVTEEA